MAWPSSFEKTISSSSFFGIFIEGSHELMLFISLPYAFLKDFNVPPVVSPPEIVYISPTGGLVSHISRVLSWLSFRWYLCGSIFLTYFYNFPCRIKVSTWSFKCLHSSVWCPWSWWNLHDLLLFLLSSGVLISFSHCREGSSLICIRTCSIGIIKESLQAPFFFSCGLPNTSCLLFFYRDCCLLLRFSSSFPSISLRALHLLRSCTSEPYGATSRLFLGDF